MSVRCPRADTGEGKQRPIGSARSCWCSPPPLPAGSWRGPGRKSEIPSDRDLGGGFAHETRLRRAGWPHAASRARGLPLQYTVRCLMSGGLRPVASAEFPFFLIDVVVARERRRPRGSHKNSGGKVPIPTKTHEISASRCWVSQTFSPLEIRNICYSLLLRCPFKKIPNYFLAIYKAY